jgi:cytochrome d ubiquinol oxidase subunit II
VSVHLYELPLIFVLVGLIFYVVLAGADFGAGFWLLFAGRGAGGAQVREHAHESMAPVWEANHVWLIFVLTVTWTAYPTAFGAIASTLSVPLFIAAIGIILRGAAYALRAGTASARERRWIDAVFAVSSILTPFALGTMVGAIAARRVPVGNAAGHLFSSWLNPTSILIGVLAVATSAYLAAVFLAADAGRTAGRAGVARAPLGGSAPGRDLQARLRTRALASGAVAGAIAVGGIVVLHADAHPLYHRLLHSDALAGLALSILAGLVTLELIRRARFQTARYTAALAVAAVVAGWALAQNPILLPGLTVRQAAAPHDTLVVVIVAVLAGAVILFPSLALLFRLLLRGQLDHGDATAAQPPAIGSLLSASAPGLLARAAAACLLAGFGFLTIAEAGWAHAIGVLALLGFIVCGFLADVPAQLAQIDREQRAAPPEAR